MTLWEEVLTLFKYGQPDLHHLYERAQILTSTDEAVLLEFEQEGLSQKLEHPGILKALKRQFQLIARRPLAVAMGDPGEDEAGTTPV